MSPPHNLQIKEGLKVICLTTWLCRATSHPQCLCNASCLSFVFFARPEQWMRFSTHGDNVSVAGRVTSWETILREALWLFALWSAYKWPIGFLFWNQSVFLLLRTTCIWGERISEGSQKERIKLFERSSMSYHWLLSLQMRAKPIVLAVSQEVQKTPGDVDTSLKIQGTSSNLNLSIKAISYITVEQQLSSG